MGISEAASLGIQVLPLRPHLVLPSQGCGEIVRVPPALKLSHTAGFNVQVTCSTMGFYGFRAKHPPSLAITKEASEARQLIVGKEIG